MFFLLWLGINALVGYAIGQRKNEVGAAIAISILLGPIGWLLALVSPGNLRKCPFCAEGVKPEAKVCRHCGRELPSMPVRVAPLNALNPNVRRNIIITLSIVAVLVLGAFIIGPQKQPQNPNEQFAHLAVAQHAPTPEQIVAPQTYYWSLRLTKPVELKDSIGRVVAELKADQSVQYISRDNYRARIRYEGADYEIPISSTDLK
jgi:hypothetical protein